MLSHNGQVLDHTPRKSNANEPAVLTLTYLPADRHYSYRYWEELAMFMETWEWEEDWDDMMLSQKSLL